MAVVCDGGGGQDMRSATVRSRGRRGREEESGRLEVWWWFADSQQRHSGTFTQSSTAGYCSQGKGGARSPSQNFARSQRSTFSYL